MTKKNTNDTKKTEAFNLEEALEDIQKPEFLKRAFVKTVDTSKIKSQSDLEKEFKKYLGD